MVQVQGTMAPMRHLHLILLLVVGLHARTVWSTLWQAQEADEGGSNDDPASRLDVALESLGHPGDPLKVGSSPTSSPIPVLDPASNLTAVPVSDGDAASQLGSSSEAPGGGMVTDVPVGKTSPAPQPDPVLESDWHHTGPPRAKDQAEAGKKSPEASEVLKQILKGMWRGHEMDQEAVKNEVFPKGRNNSVPVRAEETKATQANGMLGAVREKTTTVSDPQMTTSVYCPEDVRRRCMITTVAILISMLLALVLGCVVIKWRRKRKQHHSATSGAQLRTRGYRPLHPDSRTTRLGPPENWPQRQQPLLMPETSARQPSRAPPRPPSPSPAAQQRSRNQPGSPQPQPKRPPRPQSPPAWPSGRD